MSWNRSSSVPTPHPSAGAGAGSDALPRLPGYEILHQISEGGMAVVYKGRQLQTGAIVAIKMLTPEMAANPVIARRFEQEYRTARSLTHPNVVRCLDFGQSDAGQFLVMELIEGESLGERIDRVGPLAPAEALRLIGQVGRALDCAHEVGLIHRDVKPDNILLTPSGKALLADFGLVKSLGDDLDLTKPGQGLGTPNFIAPEQLLNAKAIDRRCDVYGLAATLYTAVTGRLPFEGRNHLHTLKKKAMNELILPRQWVPSLSEQLEAVIRRAMHPDRGQRPATCAEFLEELGFAAAAGAASGSVAGKASRAAGFVAPNAVARTEAPSSVVGARGQRTDPNPARPDEDLIGWPWLVAGTAVLSAVVGALLALWR